MPTQQRAKTERKRSLKMSPGKCGKRSLCRIWNSSQGWRRKLSAEHLLGSQEESLEVSGDRSANEGTKTLVAGTIPKLLPVEVDRD